MKKRGIVLTLVLAIAVVVVSLFIWALCRYNEKQTTIGMMPEFSGVTTEGLTFSSAEDLIPGKRTALMFFHPECEFCRKEIEGIIKRYDECRDVQWVFITFAPADLVAEFMMEYPLEMIPDSKIIVEKGEEIFKLFNVEAPPSLYIFDEERKLLKRHKGAISIKIIVEELQ